MEGQSFMTLSDVRSSIQRDDISERNSICGSSVSSVLSTRLKLKSAKAKRLIAESRLKALREAQRLEREKREIEMRQEELKQQSELEEAHLEERIWEEEFSPQESCDVVHMTDALHDVPTKTWSNGDGYHIGSPSTPRQGMCDRVSIAGNQPYSVGGESLSLQQQQQDQAFHRLADTLQEGFNLPKPELLRFNGSPLEYCKFIKNFETNIEQKVNDYGLRLSYLIQYCDGEAKIAIEDCVLLQPKDGYCRARSILYSMYGKPYNVTRSFLDNLVKGPQLKPSDSDGLSKLSLEMQKCEITLSQLGFQSDIDSSDTLRRIVKRLPRHLRIKWVDVAHTILEAGREPNFSDLAKFIDNRARVASSMYGTDLVSEDSYDRNKSKHVANSNRSSHESNAKITTLSTQGQSSSEYVKAKCHCCSGSCRNLDQCSKFKSLTLDDRLSLVRRLKLCYNCFKGNHFYTKCWKPSGCSVSDCNIKHHMLLHSWVDDRNDHTTMHSSVNCASTGITKMKNCLGIIPVVVMGENGSSYHTYALLDDGADKTLCDERLLEKIKVTSRPISFNISTVNSTENLNHGKEIDLKVRPIQGNGLVDLNRVWSVRRLPISARSAVTAKDLKEFQYLADLEIPDIGASDVMLLIGTDSPDAHVPLEVRSGGSRQPYAVRTQLGWTIRGPVRNICGSNNVVNVNFQNTDDELLHRQLEKLWNTDFNERLCNDKISYSVEDKRALRAMETSIIHEKGHYKLGLPWREKKCELPNNVAVARVRLGKLKEKLSRNPELRQKYTETVNDYIEKGYAEEVQQPEIYTSRRVWYLPHHPVTNVNKPGKVRVVFDCAAKFQGVSLNAQLMRGPDLLNSLVGVILRFRQEKIAIAADIEAMFHQVHVTDEDCDSLRFLWWPNGDFNQELKVYRMKVHLFGAKSSPSCAAFALKRVGTDNSETFDPEVLETIDKNFYVDDCLKSVDSENSAIKMIEDLRSLLSFGGFKLTKWLSNSRKVLSTVPDSDRAPSVVNLTSDDTLPSERALGTLWDVNDDKIKFKINIARKPVTRRGILSIVSAVFDPLGLVVPTTLKAKAIIQESFRLKLGWDDPLTSELSKEWHNWIKSLPNLENIQTNRCLKPQAFGEIKTSQLHIFSDASELGYGACAYLRLVDENDTIHCTLLMGKSRLAPMKQMTIPRLELSGAVLACRLYSFLSEELDMKINDTILWTDSTIVLGYIKNETKRFKTFVGNRITEIHDISSPDQWRYVDTESNPADIASRGIDASDSNSLDIWLRGPTFLRQASERWPQQLMNGDILEDDAEVKRVGAVHATTSTVIENLLSYYSDWTKLVQTVAWLLRFKDYCKQRVKGSMLRVTNGALTISELRKAEKAIITHVQEISFPNEIAKLQKGKPVCRSSRLNTLNPELYDGLIRLKGRLNLSNSEKCSIILPNNHYVTKLLIRYYHETQGHVGPHHVLSIIRQKYWIIAGPGTVKRTVKECFMCKKQRSPLCQQQMAPLLDEQKQSDKPPFTFVGIDFFGPLTVKAGLSYVKRYGCLFTCLTTRAVHIEIAHSLNTDSFIAATQRFVSRRGCPEKIFSDNGTNLVAGDRELRTSIQKWNMSKVGSHMKRHEIEWKFNPPYSSHMGGAWERMIRSIRTILKAIVKEQLLNDEQLLTFMAEAEKIMNDRPITQLSSDPRDPPALSPNMLLLMRSNESIPYGIFQQEDLYARRWWRQVQYLANIFWRRWTKEYLAALQPRQKWQRQMRSLSVGDIVLVAENTSRGQWPMARVVEIKRGRDGLVRSCVVKTSKTQLTKPVSKLCLLESSLND